MRGVDACQNRIPDSGRLWSSGNAMSPSEQDTFETEALENAEMMKKRLYMESSGNRTILCS